jgi:rod shape-determining protein MreC
VRSLIKRYREPIFVVALLAIPFAIFFVKAKKGRELNAVDRAIITVIAPVERTITGAAFGVVDALSGYFALRSVREENLELRRENLRAQKLEQQALELRLENERLKRLLEYVDKQPTMRLLVARVVAVGASPHSHTLRIARGSEDGLVKGAPVISPKGVVGTVAQLTTSYADVQLIVAPLSFLPAVNQRTRGRSTVHGTGDIARCKLEYALKTDELRDNDPMVTAGGQGSFPPGMLIGYAVNVQNKPVGLFTPAEVIPAVDFSRLDEVEIIVPRTLAASPSAEAGATP